jgi:prolyl-tRNA synthetase
LQSGTSHNLGQNFARAFNIKYLSKDNVEELCWTTSWGVSTRMVGAIVMAHGDDKGLRLPPRIAPIQVVAVPIYKTEAEQEPVLDAVNRIAAALRGAGVRVHIDNRDETPGYKFNDWEMRGVPVRLEVGPKDLEKGSAVLARRDMPGKEGKQFVQQDGIVASVTALLEAVQANMLAQATAFRDANIFDVSDYAGLQRVIEEGGWARGYWAGNDDDERRVKEETGATIRCFPLEGQPDQAGTCLLTGQTASRVALFAKAY